MNTAITYKPGDLVKARHREWVVLPEPRDDLLKLRPLGGAEDDATLIYLPLEPEAPVAAKFDLPEPEKHGPHQSAMLMRDALRLKLRAGAGPFRSFGNLNVEPRAYQLVPLLMALRLDTIRLLVADDVGIGKTIEAGLIAREMIDRGEIERVAVICPPHLCEQWQRELAEKFAIDAEVVRPGTATRLERDLRPDESVFEAYPYTIVSLDYIKSDRRRSEFLRACPEFVIVDEAHTCTRSNSKSRHQRYQLLKGLADQPNRHMVFLTATPHSGDDIAFHNLLGLLKPKFTALVDTPKGEKRDRLREELELHFVQRRRGDIAEWKDEAGFPVRESREATYQLTGDWGALFDDVLAYARTMVQRTENATKLEQRMSWWAALALLRCASSSPAAASLALRTRFQATKNETIETQLVSIERRAYDTVLDESEDGSLSLTESVPAGTVETEDTEALSRLIDRADALRGPRKDPKLNALIKEINKLVAAGFRPVVFCRYIATAHYVGKAVCDAIKGKNTHISVITGELTPDQREERIEDLNKLDENVAPILVATDCLSEGVNLQNYFNAVIHYDLTWNPTRHEQREGRADRFGQASPIVRTLMLYGEDNPVDGAVLRVIVRKAEKIRKELGIAVPLPMDNSKVIEAVMKAVLLHSGRDSQAYQMAFEFEVIETEVDDAWQTASNQRTRTVFAQRRLRPDDVLPEWRKSVSVLGGSNDVARFVRLSAERLGAPLDTQDCSFKLPVAHLPKPLQDRLDSIKFSTSAKLSFERPAPAGVAYIHRAHPLVSALADFIAEEALNAESSDVASRAGAMFTHGVKSRTVLYLLRLRSQIQVEQRGADGRYAPLKCLLAEECLEIAIRGSGTGEFLTEDETLSLMLLEPSRNMPAGQKTHLIQQALKALPNMEEQFEHLARKRASMLLADHRRVRDASEAKGLRYKVDPALPVDKIGVYVFLPMASL